MYLLDTHTLIWFLADSPELSTKAREAICSNEDIFASYISLWEMAIKKSLGKLRFQYSFKEVVQMCHDEHIQLLNITGTDLDNLDNLPFIHRDPFDRMLICQAKAESMMLLTHDALIPGYEEPCIVYI